MKAAVSGQELLETKYLIKLTKDKATFIWGSTPQKPLRSSIDLKVRINPKELLLLAREFNASVRGDRIFVQDLETYNRLLIYACVRPSLRRNLKSVHRLREQISNMTSWDSHYWASAFRELWWRYGRITKLRNVVKAFRLFFEI